MPGGTREQTIIVKMVTDQAEQKARAFDSAERARTNGRAKGEKAAAKVIADAQKEAADKASAAWKLAARRMTDDWKREAKEVAEATKKKSAAEKKAAREASDAAKKTAKETADAQKNAISDVRRSEASAAAAAARTRAVQKNDLREWRMQTAAAHCARMMEWEQEQQATKAQETSLFGAKGAVLSYIGAFATVATVVTVLKSIAEYWDHVRRDTIESVKEVLHMRDAILELAALKDKLGKTGPVLGQQLLLRDATGMKEQAANEFMMHFLGGAEAAIGSNIDAKDAQELANTVGKLQMLEGSNAGAYGDLAAAIALTAKKGATGAEMSAKANKLYEQQRPAKFTNVSQFAGQFSKASGLVQNDIYTDEELAMLLAVQSEYGPEESETRVSQLTRLAASGLMRARHIKGAPGIEHDTSAEFFKKAGITQGMRGMERIDRLSDFMIKEQDEAKAAGKPYMLREEILRHGVINSDDAEALENVIGAKRKGVWKAFKKIKDAPPDATAIAEMHADRSRKDPVFLAERAKLSEDLADVQRANSPEGGLEPLQRTIFAKRRGEGKTVGKFSEWKERGWLGKIWDDLTDPMGTHGAHFGVDQELQETLIAQAKKYHIDYRKTLGFTKPKKFEHGELYAGDEKNYELQQQIVRAGGKPLEGVSDRAAEGNATLLRMEDSMKKIEEHLRPGAPEPFITPCPTVSPPSR